MSRAKLLKALLAYGIAGIAVVLFLYGEAHSNSSYYWGKGTPRWYMAFSAFPLRVITPSVLWFLLVSIASAVWGFHSRRELLVRSLLSLGLLWLGFTPNPFQKEAPYQAFTRGFLDMARAKLQPDEVRKWAISLIGSADSTEQVTYVKGNHVPESLRTLYPDDPPVVSIEKRAASAELLRIEYGGGFSHWGFIILNTNVTTRPDTNAFCLQWVPGVYVFHAR